MTAAALPSAQAACERPVRPANRDGSDLDFHPVVVAGHVAVHEVSRDRLPASEAAHRRR